MLFQNPKEVVEALAEVSQHLWVGRRRECPDIAIGRHVAGQLVIVPEQPAQHLELLLGILAAKSAVLFGQLQQYRRGLRETRAILFQHRNFAHLVDRPPPLRRSRDAAAEVGPYRLKSLATHLEHQSKLVAVSRLREILQPVGRHRRAPCPLWTCPEVWLTTEPNL